MTKVFAFWTYDSFPYVLGAVGEIDPEKLTVRTQSYGFNFKPNGAHLMPIVEGQIILDKLMQLREEYRQAQARLHDEFIAKRNKIAPFLDEPLWKSRK